VRTARNLSFLFVLTVMFVVARVGLRADSCYYDNGGYTAYDPSIISESEFDYQAVANFCDSICSQSGGIDWDDSYANVSNCEDMGNGALFCDFELNCACSQMCMG
jgi:hypothetical protein